MSDPSIVSTVAGPFDQKRLDALFDTIKDQEPDAIVKFEGQDLLVKFGMYLYEFVAGELSKRNGGL